MWTWEDERTEWSVAIDADARTLTWGGSEKPIGSVPHWALGGGMQTQSFAEFIKHGPPYTCPPDVLAQVWSAVNAAMGGGKPPAG